MSHGENGDNRGTATDTGLKFCGLPAACGCLTRSAIVSHLLSVCEHEGECNIEGQNDGTRNWYVD